MRTAYGGKSNALAKPRYILIYCFSLSYLAKEINLDSLTWLILDKSMFAGFYTLLCSRSLIDDY